VLLVLHELVDEVRADEAGPTGDQDPQVRLDQSARQSVRIRATRADRKHSRARERGRSRTWKNLEKRSGEGVGGGRVTACSPLLPLASFCAMVRSAVRSHPNQIRGDCVASWLGHGRFESD
jgi:hypothetical protein